MHQLLRHKNSQNIKQTNEEKKNRSLWLMSMTCWLLWRMQSSYNSTFAEYMNKSCIYYAFENKTINNNLQCCVMCSLDVCSMSKHKYAVLRCHFECYFPNSFLLCFFYLLFNRVSLSPVYLQVHFRVQHFEMMTK